MARLQSFGLAGSIRSICPVLPRWTVGVDHRKRSSKHKRNRKGPWPTLHSTKISLSLPRTVVHWTCARRAWITAYPRFLLHGDFAQVCKRLSAETTLIPDYAYPRKSVETTIISTLIPG